MTTYTPEQRAARTAAVARWRDRNRQQINAQRAQDRLARRAEVARLKEESPCSDCGGYFPSVCMDYDHVGTDKVANVARLISDGPMEKILAEIAKCELVCSNCHRIRTARRLGEQTKAISQTS